MKLQVTSYSSPDVDNLWAWRPSVEDVYALIEFQVEDAATGGGDLFSVMITTPESLQKRRASAFVLSHQGVIVVSEFAWDKLRTQINKSWSSFSRS